MSNYLFRICLILIVILALSCNQTSTSHNITSDKGTYINDGREMHANLEYTEDFHDFGTIKHGEVVSYTFTLQNTGNIPLVVKDIVVGCGCTKPMLSKEILKPNEKATMEVVFDSKGWRGVQFKTVTVHSNGVYPQKSVTIKANVID
jgi:hypothetical protein